MTGAHIYGREKIKKRHAVKKREAASSSGNQFCQKGSRLGREAGGNHKGEFRNDWKKKKKALKKGRDGTMGIGGVY